MKLLLRLSGYNILLTLVDSLSYVGILASGPLMVRFLVTFVNSKHVRNSPLFCFDAFEIYNSKIFLQETSEKNYINLQKKNGLYKFIEKTTTILLPVILIFPVLTLIDNSSYFSVPDNFYGDRAGQMIIMLMLASAVYAMSALGVIILVIMNIYTILFHGVIPKISKLHKIILFSIIDIRISLMGLEVFEIYIF
jgi:hypothetical protein